MTVTEAPRDDPIPAAALDGWHRIGPNYAHSDGFTVLAGPGVGPWLIFGPGFHVARWQLADALAAANEERRNRAARLALLATTEGLL